MNQNKKIDGLIDQIIKISNELADFADFSDETYGYCVAMTRAHEVRLWLLEQKRINSACEDK